MKSTRTLITLAGLCTFLAMTGCNSTDGNLKDCPVDKDKAKQHIISGKVATAYMKSYAEYKDSLYAQLKDSTFLDREFNMPVAEMFNRDAIALLLNQDGAEGIRIYFSRDGQGQIRLVLFPVDKAGRDIKKMLMPPSTDSTDQKTAGGQQVMKQTMDDFEAVEVGQRCPTICD